jgi:hypothetical protein
MNTATDITTLSHNQTIRVKGFRPSRSLIRVRTQEGIIAEYGPNPSNEHGLLAWTIQDAAVLDRYQRDDSAKLAEIAAAPEIEHGQPVIIEGRCYTVKVNGQGFFDPVDFIPDTQPL